MTESKVRSCSAWSAELKSPASAAIAATKRTTPNRVAIPAVRPRRRSSSISWLVNSTLARLLGLGVPAGAIAGMRAVRGAYLRRVAHFAVSAVGRDRPGIVAAIAAGLLEVEGNIEDSRMTNLGGHFAVMLLVSTPSGRPARPSPRRSRRSGTSSVSRPSPWRRSPTRGDRAPDHVITVYGADHPGIVHAVAAGLADSGVNIADLQTRVGGGPDAPDLHDGPRGRARRRATPRRSPRSCAGSGPGARSRSSCARSTPRPSRAARRRAMPPRDVLLYPDRRLKQVATPAQPGEAERVAADLLDTMDALGHCVGLAAPQLGHLSRVVVVDVSGHPKAPENNGRLVLVNPQIVASLGVRGRPRGLPVDPRPDRERPPRDRGHRRARRRHRRVGRLRGALHPARDRPPRRDPLPRPRRLAGRRRVPAQALRGRGRLAAAGRPPSSS